MTSHMAYGIVIISMLLMPVVCLSAFQFGYNCLGESFARQMVYDYASDNNLGQITSITHTYTGQPHLSGIGRYSVLYGSPLEAVPVDSSMYIGYCYNFTTTKGNYSAGVVLPKSAMEYASLTGLKLCGINNTTEASP